MIKISLVLFVALFAQINGQLFSSCPISPIISNFNPSRYVGKWYEIERLSAGFEDNLKCVYAQYTPANESLIQVQNFGVNQITNNLQTIQGYAFVPNLNYPNHLRVVLRVPIAGLFIETTGKYDVWSTDYDSYSLVYSCQLVGPTNRKIENVFILSRTKTMDPAVLNNLKRMLANNNFDLSQLSVTAQDC